MTHTPDLKPEIMELLQRGTVIPAHPLALNSSRQLDERRQRALSRYYIASGAGGMAVGVHSTQFEIRDPDIGLYEPVLRLAAEEVKQAGINRPFMMIAGICGPTEQAVQEAELAVSLGYDLGLVSTGGLDSYSEDDLLQRVEAISKVIPVFGFYLQPAVGGRALSYSFWRRMAEIPGVKAIKMAPFNRYQTLDVVRAVCESSRRDEIALYTGNDDSIVSDLLTVFKFKVKDTYVEKRMVGGLLGHWAVWTSKAVELLQEIIRLREQKAEIPPELLTRGMQITDVNAALFDPANGFHGCIPGIHEVLRRQGLLEGRWCLNPLEELSPGQMNEIDRVYNAYSQLHDDDFVAAHLHEWLDES